MDDKQRAEFLKRLDESSAPVSDWEAKFIESNLDRLWFSLKQREIIDKMVLKYDYI